MSARPRIRGLLAPLALCAAASCAGKPPPQRPHVLLISIDTLRADHLSCYGYARETSPRIDALAREGVLVADCVSSTSWTLPAHLTMLTGLPVSGHGVCDDRLWTRPGPGGAPLEVEMRGVFLSEVLRGAGYRTAGFYTWKYLEPTFGFGPGFEVYERLGHTFYSFPPVAQEFERLRAANDVEGMKRLAAEHPALFDADRLSSPETVERAMEWIAAAREESPDAPFFCFVHLFDAHDPYRPPAPFDALFTDPDYAGPIDGRNVTSPGSKVRGDMPAEDLAQLVALYDGEIAWVDSQVGRLLDFLDERGLARDTLVVVTSDHGEEFYEHGNKTHRHALYRESVHVPWVLRWPRGLPSGARIEGPTGLVDLAPTVARLCGLAPPPGATGRDLSGVLRGAEANEPTTYLSELLAFDDGAVPRRLAGLRSPAEHALLEARGESPWTVELFDLRRNPREEGRGERFALGDSEGAAWGTLLEERRELVRRVRARVPSRAAGEAGGLDSAELAELASMGYAGAGEGSGSAGTAPGTAERACFDGCVWPDRQD